MFFFLSLIIIKIVYINISSLYLEMLETSLQPTFTNHVGAYIQSKVTMLIIINSDVMNSFQVE